MSGPVFILGASRSGTTMLRLMLNAHPTFAVPGEQSYFSSLPVAPEKWDAKPSEQRYAEFVTSYLTRKAPTLPGLDVEAVRDTLLSPDAPRTFREPYKVTLEAWMQSQGKVRWGEKSPTNLFYVDVIDAMFPDAQYLHIVRDPRAVVSSMNRFARCGDNTVLNAVNWQTFINRGAVLLEKTVPADRRLTLSYEELTSNPEATARRICGFLEVSFDPEMLSFYESAETYMHPVYEQLGGTNTVARPIKDRSARPKWMDNLSADQISMIESVCERGMETYGYTKSGARISPRARLSLLLNRSYAAIKSRQHAHERAHIINYEPFGQLRAPLRSFFSRREG